jgi:methylase of polypeptide subunit release factors
LRDVFGWNQPFKETEVDRKLLGILTAGGLLRRDGDVLHSRVRVASLGPDLFLHSAFPTDDEHAVFFGPDSYRFVRFILQHLPECRAGARIIDMGAGSGVGGIAVKRIRPHALVTLVDSNPRALDLAKVNATAAGLDVETAESTSVPGPADVVIANPPYMMDAQHRTYRDGGDLLGGQVALEWAEQALQQLDEGGTMLMYTGAAFTHGRSPLLQALEETCSRGHCSLHLVEIDPDVFGDELVRPSYREVERIAVFGAVVTRAAVS